MTTTVTTRDQRIVLHCLSCEGDPVIHESSYLFEEALDNLVQAAEQHFQEAHDA
jgi:hypothetical protein